MIDYSVILKQQPVGIFATQDGDTVKPVYSSISILMDQIIRFILLPAIKSRYTLRCSGMPKFPSAPIPKIMIPFYP